MKHNEIDVDINAPYGAVEKGTGILFNEQLLPHAQALVEDNTVRIWSRNTGIALGSVNNLALNFNHVFARDFTENLFGINLGDGDNLGVRCNDVTADPQLFPVNPNLTVGLNIRHVSNSVYACNPLERTGTGTRFELGCPGTDFRGNRLDAHQRGLVISKSADLNDQVDRGNTFFNMAGSNLAALRETGPLVQFYVHTSSPPFYPQTINPPAGFFVLDISGSPYQCVSEPFLCQLVPAPPREKDELDARIATGETGAAGARRWMLEKQLYRTLQARTDWISDDADLGAFAEEASNGPLGALYALEAAKQSMWRPDEGTAASLENGQSGLALLAGQLRQSEESLPANPTATDWALFGAAQQAAHAAAESLAAELETVHEQLAAARLQEAEYWLAVNAAQPFGAELWEKNDLAVNDIYLRAVVQHQPYTVQQSGELYAIASQCPLLGGDAVFKARALYAAIDPLAEFDDAVSCANVEEKTEQRTTEAIPALLPEIVAISPNPATDRVRIRVASATGVPCALRIDHLTGKHMSSAEIPGSGMVEVETTSWPTGIYLCTLLDSAGRPASIKKFVVLR